MTDEALTQARDAYLFGYADYIARYPVLGAAAPPGAPQLYAPITAEDTVSNCCRHLVFTLGMELMFPLSPFDAKNASALMANWVTQGSRTDRSAGAMSGVMRSAACSSGTKNHSSIGLPVGR